MNEYIYIYRYRYVACNLIWWAVCQCLGVPRWHETAGAKEKQGEELRNWERRSRQYKKNSHDFVAVSWAILTLKLGVSKIVASSGPTKWGYSHVCIYIYIYTHIFCRVKKLVPIIAFFESNFDPSLPLFFLFLFFLLIFFLQGEFDFFKKRAKHFDESKNNRSNYVVQHAWTNFWLKLAPTFDSRDLTFLAIVYLCFSSSFAEATTLIVLSAKTTCFKPTPKYWKHYLWTQLR